MREPVDATKTDGTNVAKHADGMAAALSNVATANESASSYTWIVRRLWFAPGYAVVVASLLAAASYPPARIVAMLVLWAAMIGAQVLLVRKGPAYVRLRFPLIQGLSMLSIVGTIALTGGLVSPMLVSLMSIAVGMIVHYGRKNSWMFGSTVVVIVLALGVSPAWITGPEVPRPYNLLLIELAFVYSLYAAGSAIVTILDAGRRAAESVDRLREQLIVEATSRARSLESITSKVAHELKNPLAAIKGLAQLLARGEADAKKKQRLDVMSQEIARMEVILRDYLSFARPIEDLRTERVDVRGLVDEVLAVLEARAEQAGVRLSAAGAGIVITADARRIKEALLNLVANALEATPAGGSVQVVVSAEETGARVVVRDTGRGLSPEALARIGTPFYSTRDGGTGLGVVLARAAVAQHGGDLTYDGALGRGTTVTITLPKAPPPRAEPHA